MLLGNSEGVSVGHDSGEVYRKMLACIKGVTESVARNVAYEFPTVRSLYESYFACRSDKERSELLVGIAVGFLIRSAVKGLSALKRECVQRGTTVNGQTTHRQIGPHISDAVYKTFMSSGFHSLLRSARTRLK